MNAVPKWFWLVLSVILLLFAVRFLHIPFFFLFFAAAWGWEPISRWFRQEFGSGESSQSGRQVNPPGEPTIRWGEPSAPGRLATVPPREATDPLLRETLAQGREMASRMRAALGGINDRQIRLRATNLADDADRILTSLRDRGDNVLAQTFNDRYLAPASTILTKYARLASRDLTTARPVLDRVETHDLPLLQRRYDEFYEQVHRGDLIDLEVASEMLSFELDAPYNGTPSLSGPQSGPGRQTPPVQWQDANTPQAR